MQEKTRILTEISMAIALSIILNFITLWQMPQGGSVTLEMLPIFIIAFRWGVGSGMLAGLGYGLIQLAFGAYIVHPAQLILDYPLPYLLLGLAGLFKNQLEVRDYQIVWILTGMVVGTLARFGSHILSGVIFFGHYAPEGQNVWLYSIIYNGSFLLPSLIISFVIILPLRKVINLNKNTL